MSDNASEFRAATFQATIAKLKARHTFIRAGRPQTNGCVERVQQTILDECWKPAFACYLIPKQTGLRLDLERYLRYYNTERAHTGRWTRRKLSTSVRQVDQGFVVPSVPSGWLIQATVGSAGGVGGLWTNRSGWAA
jgi:hypothetical protein